MIRLCAIKTILPIIYLAESDDDEDDAIGCGENLKTSVLVVSSDEGGADEKDEAEVLAATVDFKLTNSKIHF